MFKKIEIYKIANMAVNLWLILGLIFLLVYLVAAMFYGKLFLDALLKYSSWVLLATVLKIVLRRVQREQNIRLFDFVLIYLCTCFNLISWFSYPINIVLSVLCAIGMYFSYRANTRQRREHK